MISTSLLLIKTFFVAVVRLFLSVREVRSRFNKTFVNVLMIDGFDQIFNLNNFLIDDRSVVLKQQQDSYIADQLSILLKNSHNKD